MTENPTWAEWDLDGLTVDRVEFDYRVTLLVQEPRRGLHLVLGTPFEYRSSLGPTVTIDPESVTPEQAWLLLALLHGPAVRFRASSDGRCELHLGGGVVIAAAAHPQYESWEAHGTGEGLESTNLLATIGPGSPWGPSPTPFDR